ncbi:MAG TPA: sulfotransferase [Gammaproteobacteria bacterium]|nr:sulfotransferase [Gammaproteobacteria bacterium]
MDGLLTGVAHMDSRLRHASPIVVIGMHRSGTRLLVDILDKLGVFMGADRQADSESVAFMLINEEILHQCGAFWSEPMSAHFLLAQPDAAAQLAESVREALAAQLDKYAGPSGWHRGSSQGDLPAFGWKDPRNTFTLPVWKQVFPSLRTLHIVRHGVDVAASLARRHAEALRAATGESIPSALTVIRDHALGVLSSRRGWTLAEAFTMWEQYVEKGRQESAALGERALEVRYEDLLMRPEQVIPAVAKFCGVPVPARQEALLDGLEAGRAFAFRRDPELVAFAGSVRGVLARYGYTT